MKIRYGVMVGLVFAMFSSLSWSQEKTSLPEFFGFYALDGGQSVSIYEGQSSGGARSAVINGYSIPQNSRFQDTRPQISTAARFILFYSNSGEMIQAISLYRLPMVRHVIESQRATAFSPPTRQIADSPNTLLLARIPDLAFRLLAKPVPDQPQMVELVASPKLTPGLYVVEYSPNGKGGWFATFSVTSASEIETQYCVDLILPGGPGGLFFRANSELAENVPLLAPNDYSRCDGAGRPDGNTPAGMPAESSTSSPTPNLIPWTDPATGLHWTRGDNNANIGSDGAVEYCKNLNLGGERGWRLPTIDELKGIYDRSANVPPTPRPELAGMNVQFASNHVKGNLQLSGLELSATGGPSAEDLAFDFGTGKERALKSDDKKWRKRALCVRNP